MSHWQLQEWRAPRTKEIVQSTLDGALYIVTKVSGLLNSKQIWADDVDSNPRILGEPAENFTVVDKDTSISFLTSMYEKRGVMVGGIVYPIDHPNSPLLIEKMTWTYNSLDIVLSVRNLKSFDSKIDCKVGAIAPFKIPAKEIFFSKNLDSILKYRINLEIIEKLTVDNIAWNVNGSFLEFSTEELARREIKAWASRMKIRRISSVLKGSSISQNWIVEGSYIDDVFVTRIAEKGNLTGNWSFATPLDAATAIALIDNEEWECALATTTDNLNL